MADVKKEFNSLPKTAEALVVTGPNASSVQTVDVVSPCDDGGVGRVLAAGVCGSDLALLRGGATAERIWPFVLGHENVVRVETASSELTHRWGVAPGDVVFVEEFVPCGWCQTCREGNYQVCPRTDFNVPGSLRYGRTSLDVEPGLWGGFAEYLFLHRDARLHRIPQGVSPERAVLATPLANGLRWIGQVARLQPMEDVVILGPGANGLACLVAARLAGAREVTVVGRSNDFARLSAALALGASEVLCIDRDDVEAAVMQRTGGRGASVVLDVTGADAAASMALRLTAPGGRLVSSGGSSEPVLRYPIDLVTRKELTVLGVRGHRGPDLENALRLLASDRVDLSVMSTSPVPLDAAPSLISDLALGRLSNPSPHYVVQPTEHP